MLLCQLDVTTDNDGQHLFTHRVKRGIAEQSHGIAVAGLAQLPRDVLAEATRIRASIVE